MIVGIGRAMLPCGHIVYVPREMYPGCPWLTIHQRKMVSYIDGGSLFDTFVLADQPSRSSGPRS
jgi:hypothetical protein